MTLIMVNIARSVNRPIPVLIVSHSPKRGLT
jgi:hypothetical protein